MPTEQIVLWTLGTVGSALTILFALLKTVVPRIVDTKLANESLMTKAEVEARAYSREREIFQQDATFEMLKETLTYLAQGADDDRRDAKEERAAQADLIKAINRIANNVAQNTDVLRMIVQQSSKVDDRLEQVERILREKG